MFSIVTKPKTKRRSFMASIEIENGFQTKGILYKFVKFLSMKLAKVLESIIVMFGG